MRSFILACLAISLGHVVIGQDGTFLAEGPVVASKEYFIQQESGEAITVRVGALEAEFLSRVFTEEGELIAESGVTNARSLPVYQYISESDKPRQITIRVDATQVTSNTQFELDFTRLQVRDQQSAQIASAYHAMAYGLETLPGGSVQDWTVKINTIIGAGRQFGHFGMTDMSLWSAAYAAHLVLHELRDPPTALEMAEELLSRPRLDRYPEIQFAALKTMASASGSLSAARASYQDQLAELRSRARSLDYRFEEASALLASGTAHSDNGRYDEALEALNEALEISEAIAASDLATTIRERILAILEMQGNEQASGRVLQDIEAQLVESGQEEELARNLLQQGRLQTGQHQYQAAIANLARAAELEHSIATGIEIQLALGHALFETGQNEQSLAHLYGSVINPETGDVRQPNSVLDTGSALSMIADIHRRQGEFARMDEARAIQEAHLQTPAGRAQWAYSRAVDKVVSNGAASASAVQRLQEARRIADSTGDRVWRDLATMRLCAQSPVDSDPPADCREASLHALYETVRNAGSDRQAAEATTVYAALLYSQGKHELALEVAGTLIEELSDPQANGPGALGAWYLEWRQSLFSTFLRAAAGQDSSRDRAERSWLAINRLRFLESGFRGHRTAPDRADLKEFLESIPGDAAGLTFYLDAGFAWAWIASSDGVRRFELPDPSAIIDDLEAAREQIQDRADQQLQATLSRLGRRIIQPLEETLARTLFIAGDGPMLGIPLDALTQERAALLQSTRLIHVARFSGDAVSAFTRRWETPNSVFLAGDPRDFSADYPTRIEPSPELKAVTARFVGSGLQILQGIALLRDEFETPIYSGADLVHLAVPATIDLRPGGSSQLTLSEPARGSGRQTISAAGLAEIPTNAELALLSGLSYEGASQAAENDRGVIDAMLRAGAHAVIATLWEVDGPTRAHFADLFYGNLDSGGNVAEALWRAKIALRSAGSERDWAAFQLFLD